MILKHSRIFSLIILLLSAQLTWAGSVTPASNLPTYYSRVDGRSAKVLFDSIHSVAKVGYSGLSYNALWTAYCAIDINASGYVWDMYSNATSYTCGGSAQGANYSKEGDSYNREHSIPKSWFGQSSSPVTASPGTDLFHVVPTDGYVNNERSAYAFGEVSSASYTSNSGCKKGTPKSITISNTILSSSTQSCSASTVFEPMAEYKGDFARGYFGSMIMWANGDYQTFTSAEGAQMFNTAYDASHYYGLTGYGLALLLKWHREDPVSQKEIDRNNGIQGQQGNRNPFIDYPILAEYIWGKYAGETFSLDNAVGSFDTSNFTPGESDGDKPQGPTITVSPSSLTLDPVNVNGSSTKTFTITGYLLSNNISISRTSGSSYFSVNTSSITSNYNSSHTITVTYNPKAQGEHSAVFTITSGSATSKTVTVSSTCTTVHTVTWRADDGSNPYYSNTAANNTAPTVPDAPEDCSVSRIFVGWTLSSSVSSKPADLFTTTAPAVTSATTFYAVYADTTESGGATTYSIASSIAADDQVIIACNTQGKTAGALSSTYLSSVTSTFSSDKTTITELGSGTLIFTVGGSNGAWTLTSSSGALGASATKSVNLSGTGTATWSITISSGTATITNGTSSYGSLKYNSQSPRFTTYASGQTDLQLYKVTGGITIDTTNYSLACSESSCTLSSISLNTSGVQTSFAVGDAFNYTGLVVTASYSDCVSKTVSPTSVSSPNMSTTGDKTVTVSYTEGGTTKTANYTINVETAPEYTVTFMNMGAEHATRTGTAGSAMSAISNPTACEGYTFVGWSTATQATEATSKPSTTTPTTIPAENTTYHAVYSRTESSGSGDPVITYEKVTEAPSDWSGNYLVVYETDSKVFNGLSSKGSYETTTITTGVIAHTDALELCEVVIAKMTGDNYSIQMNSSATNNASKYLSGTSGSNTMNFGESASENTIALSGSDVLLTSNTSVLRFNNDANNGNMFRYYKASGYSNQKAIQLYQRIETGGSSSTTYYTTSPNCCKATLTVQSPDDTMGTVSIE